MALAIGTGMNTPKPPKPQVSYGAPSGPYASPAHAAPQGSGVYNPNPAAVLANQQAWNNVLGGGTAAAPYMPSLQLPMSPLGSGLARGIKHPESQPIDEYYAMMGNLIRGGRGADPTTLDFGGSLKFGAELASMFPLGPGPEIGAASKAPRALSLLGDALKGLRGEKNAARAVSYPTGSMPVTRYPLARLGEHAGFGPEVQAHRAAVEAPSIEEHLATLRALTKRHMSNMVSPEKGKISGYRIPGKGTVQRGPDPMEGKYFDYTGQARPKDPMEMQHMIREFIPEYEDPLYGGAFAEGGGFQPDAENIHNIQDKFGNTIGSLTYTKNPGEHIGFGQRRGASIEAHEGYIRPEARNMENLFKLAQPIMESGLPIDAMVANPRLGRMLAAMEKRGKLPKGSNIAGKSEAPKGSYRGRQEYEVPQELLPELFRGYPRLFGSEQQGMRYNPLGNRTPAWGKDWPMGFNPAR